MEPKFGHDFGDVRVHTGARATEAAEAMGAMAFTVGSDVVLGRDQLSPATTAGQRLLGHELAHVVQQRRGGQTPSTVSSTPPEHEADAAATAIGEGRQTVSVRLGTGVGVARQPKDKTPTGAVDFDQLVTEGEDPRRHPNVADPRSSPRYIDNLFEDVNYQWFNGASVFRWKEGGKDQKVVVPLRDLEQDDTRVFVQITEPIYDSKQEALEAVAGYQIFDVQVKVYAYYRAAGNIIMPTTFSIDSTPKFHKHWPAMRKRITEDSADIRRGLMPIANLINPIPGTQVDEYGNLSLSSNPMDWLPLIFHFRDRLSKIKEAGPVTRRLHSGEGVPYTVLGPHGKLSGTMVYVLKDAEGTVLYVGKGDTLDRLRSHITDPKKTQWFGEIRTIEVWATDLSNTQAFALEEDLISKLDPLHNKDRHPFQKEFKGTMEIGRNLPAPQKVLIFWLDWGH